MHSATFLLHSNLFRCYGKHIGLAWPHCNDTSVTLLQNTFKRSSNTAVELYLPNVPLIHVKGNTFSDLKGAALSLRLSDAVDSDSHSVVISDNLFTAVGRPHIDSVVSVNCFWGRQSASLVHVLNISLSRNDFYFNLASATVVTSCASLFLTENTFVNPGAVHDYGVRVSYEDVAVMFAPLNYWNAVTFNDITRRIYDYTDDENVAYVQVSPWYLDQNRTQTAIGGNIFFKGPFEIGGRMEEDITLSNMEQPYRVTGNIVVPHGRTLLIESGVMLLFANGGIIVEGEFSVFCYFSPVLLLFFVAKGMGTQVTSSENF